MCGRFAFFIDTGETEQIFDAKARVPLEPRYNISPSQEIYTITNETPDEIGEPMGADPELDRGTEVETAADQR